MATIAAPTRQFEVESTHPRRYHRLILLTFALTVTGWQLVTFLHDVLGLAQTRFISVPFHGLMALLYVSIIVSSLVSKQARWRLNPAICLGLTFWFVYSIRVVLDTVPAYHITFVTSGELWLYAFGISFLSYAAYASVTDGSLYERALVPISLLLVAACILIIYARANSTIEDTLSANKMLNHITAGHTGGFAVLLGMYQFFVRPNKSWKMQLLAVLMIPIGAATILLSAARGALVGVGLVGSFLVLQGWRRGHRLRAGLAIAFGAIAVLVAIQVSLSRGVDPARYLGSVEAFTKGESTEERYRNYHRAISLFMDNPVFGKSLVLRDYQAYPHNVVLESFMATGIIGGLPFLAMLLFLWWKALRMIHRGASVAWIAVLFLQATSLNMFSGSLYAAEWFWAFGGAIAGMDLLSTEPKRRLSSAEQAAKK